MTQVFSALRLAPVLPAWLLLAFAAAALAICALALLRRARGAWLRAAAFAVILAWLAGPVLVRETRQGLRDIALLVLDRSDSMQVGNRAALTDQPPPPRCARKPPPCRTWNGARSPCPNTAMPAPSSGPRPAGR